MAAALLEAALAACDERVRQNDETGRESLPLAPRRESDMGSLPRVCSLALAAWLFIASSAAASPLTLEVVDADIHRTAFGP